MANQKIADAAHAAMHDASVESKPGFCSRFVRQVVSKVYGDKYQGLFGASAIDTGRNFEHAGLDASATQSSQLEVGDILFKMQGSGGFGHVGIYVGEKGVASNSSTPLGRLSGAKGYRTLGQWGQWQLVGRIPGESPAASDQPLIYHLVLNGVKVADMPVHNGQALCPARLWANAMHLNIDWHEETHRVLFNGVEVSENATMIQDHAYLPIRVLVDAANKVVGDNAKVRITTFDAGKHLVEVGK